MKQNNLERLVGLFVLLGLAAVAYLTIQLGTGSFVGEPTYLIEARFTNTGGLHSGSSVSMAGVTVGRVEKVWIDPTDFSAIATLRVLTEIQLPTDSMAAIRTSGLIGDKFVALSAGAEEAVLEPGHRITMTESAVDLESLISKMAFGTVAPDEKTEPIP